MGCLRETFSGLAGKGDLIVVATCKHYRWGYLAGMGYNPSIEVKQVGMMGKVINILPVAMTLAEKYHVEIPIVMAVVAVINHGADSNNALRELLVRGQKKQNYPNPLLL